MMRRFGGLAGLSFLKRKTLRFFVAFNFLFTAAILGLDARAATSPPSKRGEVRSLASMATFAAVYLAEGTAFLLFGARIIAAVGGRNDALKMSRMVFVCAGGFFALGMMMVIQALPGTLGVTHADRAFALYSTGPKLVELIMCMYMLSAIRRVRGPMAWAKRQAQNANKPSTRPRSQSSILWLLRRLGFRTVEDGDRAPVRPPPRALRVGLAQREPSMIAIDEGMSFAEAPAPGLARTPSFKNPMFHAQQTNPVAIPRGGLGGAAPAVEARSPLTVEGGQSPSPSQSPAGSARPSLVDLIARLSETLMDSSSDDEAEFEPPPDFHHVPGTPDGGYSGRGAAVTPTESPGRSSLTGPPDGRRRSSLFFQHGSSSPRSSLSSPTGRGSVSLSRAKKLRPSVVTCEEIDLGTEELDFDPTVGGRASFVMNPILATEEDGSGEDIQPSSQPGSTRHGGTKPSGGGGKDMMI
jgi:hypothetical protein